MYQESAMQPRTDLLQGSLGIAGRVVYFLHMYPLAKLYGQLFDNWAHMGTPYLAMLIKDQYD